MYSSDVLDRGPSRVSSTFRMYRLGGVHRCNRRKISVLARGYFTEREDVWQVAETFEDSSSALPWPDELKKKFNRFITVTYREEEGATELVAAT